MKTITDYQRLFESDDGVIDRLLSEWKPRSGEFDEKDREQEMFGWLKEQLPGVAMKTQYGVAWGTADIVIEDTYLIELKLGFTAKSVTEFDRCLGQLWRYKEKWIHPKPSRRVRLVLIDESEAEFHHLLTKFFKELNSPFFGKPFRWLEKPVSSETQVSGIRAAEARRS